MCLDSDILSVDHQFHPRSSHTDRVGQRIYVQPNQLHKWLKVFLHLHCKDLRVPGGLRHQGRFR